MKRQNVAASVHQRLLNEARATGRPFNELLQYYSMERFLYRLSKSPHQEKFVLKGALMLTVWKSPVTRPTRDIDMLGQTENSIEGIVSLVREICCQTVEPDGIVFDPETVSGERSDEDADYEGVRVRFRGNLGTARIPIQIDVGFGDVVVPETEATGYPTNPRFPCAPHSRIQQRKHDCGKIRSHGQTGSPQQPYAGFHDIWLLSRQFDYDGRILVKAIRTTFSIRRTEVSADSTAFSEEFARDRTKFTQWRAFLRKSRIVQAPENFEAVIAAVATFLKPPAESIVRQQSFRSKWKAPGPWN